MQRIKASGLSAIALGSALLLCLQAGWASTVPPMDAEGKRLDVL